MKDYNFFEVYGMKKGSLNIRSPYFVGALIVLLFLIVSALLVGRNMVIENEIKSLYGEIEALKSNPVYEEAMLIKQSINDLNQYDSTADAVMKKFENSNVVTTDLLARISAQIPETATLTAFNIDNASAVITLRAPNRKAVAEAVLHLKESGLFRDVTFDTVTNLEGVNGVEVVINGTMKAGEAQ